MSTEVDERKCLLVEQAVVAGTNADSLRDRQTKNDKQREWHLEMAPREANRSHRSYRKKRERRLEFAALSLVVAEGVWEGMALTCLAVAFGVEGAIAGRALGPDQQENVLSVGIAVDLADELVG
jgi:uncharacterized MAPEG superfamily protein